jgi:hypothetical protein
MTGNERTEMSKTITLKRIALVAVSALGFGLMSVVPASAAQVDAVTTASLAPTAGASDPTIDVTLGGSGRAITAEVRSATGTISLADLTLTVTGTVASGPDDYTIVVTTDDISAGAADDYSAKEVAQADVTTAAFTAVTLDGLAATTQATKTSGGVTHGTPDTIGVGTYYINVDVSDMALGSSAGAHSSSNDVLITMTVSQAAMVVATLDTTTTTLAGRVGQQVSITPTATVTELTASTTTHPRFRVSTSLSGQPSVPAGQSIVRPTINAVTTLDTDIAYASAGNVIDDTGESTSTSSTADATNPATINYSGLSNKTITTNTNKALGTITFTPVAAGVYTLVVWNESSTSGTPALSGSESFQTFTINVTSSAASTVSLTTFGGTSVAGGSSGALIKVSLKDAAGNIAIPATGETVTITPSGTGDVAKVNDGTVASDAGAAYNLSAADFGQTGTAWINVINASAGTSVVTATISGSSSAATTLTFRTVTADTDSKAPLPYSATATGYETYTAADTTALTAYIPLGTTTTTFRSAGTYSDTTPVYHEYRVVDTMGGITGALPASGSYDWDAASTLGSTGYATYSVTSTNNTTGTTSYTVTDADTNGTTTVQARSIQGGAITPTVNTIASTSGGSVTITGVLKDTFGRALGSTAVTAVVTGRNPTTVAQTAITDSLGNFSFTIADANTTSLLTSDTVTLDSAAYTTTDKVVTILYGTANAASKVVLTTPNTTAGVANDSVSAKAISAGTSATGKAGAEAGAFSITAKVTNSAGAVLSGVPVTWSVAGDGAAILSTTKLVYTDLTGTATTSIYGWKAGTYTVTATAGAISGTGTVTFAQSTASSARKITATASGNVVTAKAEDRFGNPVTGVRIYAKIASGTGYFGTGVTDTYTDTTTDGTAKFVVSGGTSSVTVSNISFSSVAGTIVGQTSAAAGSDIGGADAVAFVAPVAGTATVAEAGTGNVADFTAAGVSSATVSVTLVDAAAAAAEAASDAAAEAIDAANAATDAANLAAEAADAATVAAEEARDAADAATAAVEELATQVATLMAALKAQITTLANTVAKIAKKVKA